MKRLILGLLVIILASCNPILHMVGVGARKFNTSQNKYSKKNPYIKKN